MARLRPWREGDHRRWVVHLVRREAYICTSTHRAIRAPDDDMRLGKLLKRAGFQQGAAYGTGSLSVEWHRTFVGAVRGLKESMFSGVNYRLSMALFASRVLFLTNVLPFAGLFLARRALTNLLFGKDVLLVFAMYAHGTRRSRSRLFSPLYAALHPFGVRSSSTQCSGPRT